MNIERQDTGTLTADLKLKLAPEDYTPGVEKALKEQRRTATLPGFRPGQVPMAIIRKRVGKSILINEVERLVGRTLTEYIQDNKLRVLGQPLPKNDAFSENNWDEPGELTFHYEMGMAPTFDVELGEKLGVEYPVIDVNDELVSREISDMQRRFGTMSDAEVSGDKDMLIGDVIELDGTGAIKPGGLMNRTSISLEFLKDDATRALFTGKKAGDEVTADPNRISDNHDDLARMFGVDHAAIHALEGNVLFRIAEIKRMDPVPVDQALFDRVYGQGAVADESDFRKRVKEGIEGQLRRDSDRVFKRLVMRKLEQNASIDLPEAFLKRWIQRTSEKPITSEEVESGFAGYAQGLRRQLVEDRILEKYGLEAKGEELDAFAKRYVTDQFTQYGMPAPDEVEVQKIAGRLLGDREQIKRMRDSIVEQKLMAHFKAMLSPKEKRVGFDEFVNLARTA
ncbi:MAG TPA: trigger factor [Flavobacteriales bacterium]